METNIDLKHIFNSMIDSCTKSYIRIVRTDMGNGSRSIDHSFDIKKIRYEISYSYDIFDFYTGIYNDKGITTRIEIMNNTTYDLLCSFELYFKNVKQFVNYLIFLCGKNKIALYLGELIIKYPTEKILIDMAAILEKIESKGEKKWK